MPYNPGISPDFTPLAAGIASFGESVGRGIERYKADSQKAKSLRSALGAYAPDQKAKFESMGLAELEGEVASLAMTRAKMEQERQTKLAEAQLRNMEADNQRGETSLGLQANALQLQQQQFQQQSEQLKSLSDFAKDFVGAPSPLNEQGKLRYALGRNPGVMDQRLLMTLAEAAQQTQREFTPTGGTIDVGGRQIPYVTTSRGSAQPLPEFVQGNPKYAPRTRSATPSEVRQILAQRGKLEEQLLSGLTLKEEQKAALQKQIDDLNELLRGAQITPEPAGESGKQNGSATQSSLADFMDWKKSKK